MPVESASCNKHIRTSTRTHARDTYGHVRARARADLEEAKGEEREDVDSPPSDRDRVVRRDAASCCRSTVSGSLKVSSYRRWTGSVERTSARERSRFVSLLLLFLDAAVASSTIMQLKKAMLKILDQCKFISRLYANALRANNNNFLSSSLTNLPPSLCPLVHL